jgi:hypothetical protein
MKKAVLGSVVSDSIGNNPPTISNGMLEQKPKIVIDNLMIAAISNRVSISVNHIQDLGL